MCILVRRAPATDLGHEGIGIRLASVTGRNGIDKRKVAGKGESRDVGFTKRIYGDAPPLVFIGAAEARGIKKGVTRSI